MQRAKMKINNTGERRPVLLFPNRWPFSEMSYTRRVEREGRGKGEDRGCFSKLLSKVMTIWADAFGWSECRTNKSVRDA